MPKNNCNWTQEKIDAVTAGLSALCEDLDDVTYVEITASPRLGYGSISDGYLHADGVHLRGTE